MEITKKSKTINSDIGLSIYLVEEGEGHNLQMKSNLGSQDVNNENNKRNTTERV